MARPLDDDELVGELIQAIDVAMCEGQLADELENCSAATFKVVGVLTQDAGFVLRLRDNSEYQITVKRSR